MTMLWDMGLTESVFMGICGIWSFVSYREHLLNTLLSLEFLMLAIFWLIGVKFSLIGCEAYFMLFFLALVACEGSLGLSLLVSVVRTHGNDQFNSFSVLGC